MTRRPLRNVEASVRQRLLDQARAGRVPYEDLARRYAIERLLYRLARSPHRDGLVLKGATLFTVWTSAPHRTTRDVDFLGRGTPDLARVVQVMHDLCRIRLADGLVFDETSVCASRIRKEQPYLGARVLLTAFLGKSRIPLPIDAIRATFLRRGTPVPADVPDGLSDRFLEDPRREAAWAGFLRRTQARGGTPSFHQAGAVVRSILWPLVSAA